MCLFERNIGLLDEVGSQLATHRMEICGSYKPACYTRKKRRKKQQDKNNANELSAY
jgi:hypothetical protein